MLFERILFNCWGWGGFHSAALEVGPQPNGVLRADIYNLVKEAVELTFEFVEQFNAGERPTALQLH